MNDEICSIDYHNEQMCIARKETIGEFAFKLKERLKVVSNIVYGVPLNGCTAVTLSSVFDEIDSLLKEYEQ